MPESPILRTGRRENKLRSPIFSHQQNYSQQPAEQHHQTLCLSEHEESVISDAKSVLSRRVVESPLEKELMEPLNFDESDEDEQNENQDFDKYPLDFSVADSANHSHLKTVKSILRSEVILPASPILSTKSKKLARN